MKKNVVVFGGGTGLSFLVKGLKQFPVDITAVVSVCDDGGSTGILRDEFDILAVGDIRKVLVSLSHTEKQVEKLFNYRFKSNGSLNTHTVGNILLTAAKDMTGNIQQGIELLGKVLNLSGKIIPFTEENITLYAEMDDSSIVEGEHYITESSKKIKRVFYKDEPCVSSRLINEIKNADLIVLSMGSLYTSIIPCLLSKRVLNAIDKSKAKIMYVCNLFTQPGETDNFKLSDHINILNSYLGNKKVSFVIANNGQLDKKLAKKYLKEEQKDIVEVDNKKTSKLVDKLILNNLITIEDNYFRHDTLKLGYLIFSELLEINDD